MEPDCARTSGKVKSRLTEIAHSGFSLGDQFAQRRLGCRAEAGRQIVVDGNFLGAAVERAEPVPLVEERPGDPFGQR